MPPWEFIGGRVAQARDDAGLCSVCRGENYHRVRNRKRWYDIRRREMREVIR